MNTLLNRRFSSFCALITLFSVCFLTVSAFAVPANQLRWETDLNAAKARAEVEQRPLFLHFVGTGTPASQEMATNVFTLPNIAATLNANFVLVKINASENPALAQRFSITSVPTDLIMLPNGRTIHQRVGAIPADLFVEYLAFLQRKIQADRELTPATPVAASHAISPPASSPSIVANPFPMADAGTPVPSRQPTPPAATTPPAAMAHGLPQSGMAAAPGATAPLMQQLPVASPTTQPPFAAQQSQPSPNNNPLRTGEMATVPPMAPLPMVQAPVTQPPMAQTPPVMGQTTPPPHHPGLAGFPAASNNVTAGNAGNIIPLDLPAPTKMMIEVPLALEGFCPVTLQTSENWIPGNPAFSTMYQGHIFRFATWEALVTFAQHPGNFSPVAMGEDIVLIVDRNRRVNGSRDFAASFQGRILLFSSQETFNTFSAQPEHYMGIALRYETARKGTRVSVVF